MSASVGSGNSETRTYNVASEVAGITYVDGNDRAVLTVTTTAYDRHNRIAQVTADDGRHHSIIAPQQKISRTIDANQSDSVGISVSRGTTSATDVNSTRVILVRDASMPTGYKILIRFPIKP